jgi:hypothetical protein
MNYLREKGIIILISFLSVGVLSILAVHLLSFTLTESDMSQSESASNKAYYLAEAGINDGVWQLNNDSDLKNSFLEGTLSEDDDILRDNVFGNEELRYEISFLSTAPGEAEIISRSFHDVKKGEARRAIKTYLSKALGFSDDWDCAVFSGLKGDEEGGNIDVTGSSANISVSGARFHANNDIQLTGADGFLNVNNGGLTAGGNVDVGGTSEIILDESYQDYPTSTIDMPPIDFGSWKERSTQAYTASDFESLPSDTVLNGIVYVEGNPTLSRSNYNLTVNGVLVVDGYLKLSGSRMNLDINYDENYGGGLLVNGNLKINGPNIIIDVEGLFYTSKEFRVNNASFSMNCSGALISSNVVMSGSNIDMNISFNQEYFQNALDSSLNPDSNIIRINHWEEVY